MFFFFQWETRHNRIDDQWYQLVISERRLAVYRRAINWLVIDYWRWSMSNRWVIEAQKFCGLSITHWCNWLLINDPLITHQLLYCARKKLFLLSCTICFSFVILLSVLDAFFLVSELPVDDLETQSANHQYKWFSIVQFAKLNNLDGATVKCGPTKMTTERYWNT